MILVFELFFWFIILYYFFALNGLILVLKSKLLGVFGKTVLSVILLAIIISPILIVVLLRRTPSALSINDVINISDKSQQLSIVSIEMSAPTYLSGEGFPEKSYSSIVTINVTNNSDQQVYLGLDSYADSGTLAFYSPGSSHSSKVLAIDANWTGELQFPIKHPRFVNGGYIKLTLVKCRELDADIFYDLPGTILFEKKYNMVAEE